jgi:hypothetical protein
MTHSLYREQVGFMTYDNKINFYNCNKALAQPQQMTVGDVQVNKKLLWTSDIAVPVPVPDPENM